MKVFALDGFSVGQIPNTINADPSKKINENLAASYPGGRLRLLKSSDGVFDDRFSWSYPGDPVRDVQAIIIRGSERMFIYQSAFALLIDGEGHRYFGRLD